MEDHNLDRVTKVKIFQSQEAKEKKQEANIKRKKKKNSNVDFSGQNQRQTNRGFTSLGTRSGEKKNRTGSNPREKVADEDPIWKRGKEKEGLLFFLRPLFYKPWLSIYLSQWSSQQHLRALTFRLRGSDSGVMLGQSRRLKERKGKERETTKEEQGRKVRLQVFPS